MNSVLRTVLTAACVVSLSACSSAYYGAMEKVGIHKRDILVDRVDEARDAQSDAQVEFKSALERLDELLQFDGGELEATYNALNDDYESSKAAAERVDERIEAIDTIRGEYRSLQSDISSLIAEMEQAITESDAFIQAMQEGRTE